MTAEKKMRLIDRGCTVEHNELFHYKHGGKYYIEEPSTHEEEEVSKEEMLRRLA